MKAQTVSMFYNDGKQDYLLHLVDTPGHVISEQKCQGHMHLVEEHCC